MGRWSIRSETCWSGMNRGVHSGTSVDKTPQKDNVETQQRRKKKRISLTASSWKDKEVDTANPTGDTVPFRRKGPGGWML